MVKALDCGLKVSKFKLQLYNYIYFQINTMGKSWIALSLQLWVK